MYIFRQWTRDFPEPKSLGDPFAPGCRTSYRVSALAGFHPYRGRGWRLLGARQATYAADNPATRKRQPSYTQRMAAILPTLARCLPPPGQAWPTAASTDGATPFCSLGAASSLRDAQPNYRSVPRFSMFIMSNRLFGSLKCIDCETCCAYGRQFSPTTRRYCSASSMARKRPNFAKSPCLVAQRKKSGTRSYWV